MSHCPNCNANIQEGAKFCAVCGTQITVNQYSVPVSAQNPPRQNDAKKLHCPQCKSHEIHPITESSVTSALTSSRGSLSSTMVSNIHRNYWMCSTCGTKFRSLQSLEEEIARVSKQSRFALICSIIGLVLSIFLLSQITNPIMGLIVAPVALGAIVGTLVSFILMLAYKKKVKKMQLEWMYLKTNCFD